MDTKTITKLDMNTIALYINDFVKDDFAKVKVRQSTSAAVSRSASQLPVIRVISSLAPRS